MVPISSRIRRLNALFIAFVAAGAFASCAPYMASEPEPVAAENPSVIYKYDSEQALLEASHKARAFCSRYRATPHAAATKMYTDADGRNTVVIECGPTGQSMMTPTTTA